jgi:hypothetical protein
MSKQDDADAAFYDNPDNLRTRGPVHRRTGHPRLSSHTPVRFDPETITAIRRFSDEDGVTVSAWVRRVVKREIQRRINLRTHTASARGFVLTCTYQAPIMPTSVTVAVSADDVYADLQALADVG